MAASPATDAQMKNPPYGGSINQRTNKTKRAGLLHPAACVLGADRFAALVPAFLYLGGLRW
jgi:hypothetical protein